MKRVILMASSLAIIVTLVTGLALAGSVPNTFTAGTPAKAAEVNANFAYLQNLVDTLSVQMAGLAVVPTGTVVAFAGVTPPAGWLLCDGSLVSRTTYSALYSVIGTIHGSGDNVSTFNLPDYRGRFLRGVNGSAVVSQGSTTLRDPDATNRTAMNSGGNTGNNVGSVQADTFKSHNHFHDSDHLSASWTGDVQGNYLAGNLQFSRVLLNSGYTTTAGNNETRPTNAYVNYIIKY